jgi:voltage-gated potassium channel
MTDSPGPSDGTHETPPPHRLIARTVARAVGSTVALVTIYYLLPLDRSSTGVAVMMLGIGLALLTGLIAFHVRTIVVSPHPALRAAEALATSVPLFLLLFAATYTVMSRLSAGDFSEPLTRTDALYFTVTVFATVGFGDIAAKTETARLVVTGQMIADLIVIGLGLRVIVGAVSHGRQRRARQADTGHRTEQPHA